MIVDKVVAACLHFPGLCEEDLDKVLNHESSRLILKQFDYLLSISMRQPHQLSRDRKIQLLNRNARESLKKIENKDYRNTRLWLIF